LQPSELQLRPLSHHRFGSLHHHAVTRHFHFRIVAHQKCHHACHDRTGRQYHKAERYIASRVLDPADSIWAYEAAEIADRIYQCNAAGSGGAGEKAGREGPEGGHDRKCSHYAYGESNSRKNGIAKIGASDQRQAADDCRANHVPNSLMRDVRVACPPNYCDYRERIRNRNKVARQRIDRNTGDVIEPGVCGHTLDDLRQPVVQAIYPTEKPEVDEARPRRRGLVRASPNL